MSAPSDDVFSTAPENTVPERDAFERDKKNEWGMIEREKKSLDEERAEAARLKRQLVMGISEYFFRKAELEGGLVPSSPRHQLAENAKDPEQPSKIPLRTKQGTLGLQKSPTSRSPDGHDDTANSRSPSPLSLAQFADDEEGHSALTLPKRKRGQPGKNAAPQVTTQDETSSELPSRQAKRRGRRKIYHQTAYGTKLPLVYLLSDGRMKVADQIQVEDPQGWNGNIRFIKDRQLVAPPRFRTGVEKKSKDCMASFFDLERKTKWSSGPEKRQACNDCQKSETPCIILDSTGTKMILLPRPDES
ncbi:hypothetical protein SLS56_000704 [Neofusicoccum ribis]|uniref:Uncharacterized protein n=1 Tax=Neofusicoccum ribis TaxID=45134 RepID=A0ABR3TD98_9PEZI